MANRLVWVCALAASMLVACGDDSSSGGAGASGTSGGESGSGGSGGGDADAGPIAVADAGPVKECPMGAECIAPVGEFICGTGIPPMCETQKDCPYGECMQFPFGGFCILPCVGDTPATVSVSGKVLEMMPGKGFANGAEPGLQGVEVCVADDSDVACVTTDAKGSFKLVDVPSKVDQLVTFTKDGYAPAQRPVAAPVADFTISEPHTRMATDERAKAVATAAGATYPDAKNGAIGFGALRNNDDGAKSPFAVSISGIVNLIFLDGYSVTLDPKVADPVYMDADEDADPDLKASSEAGWGQFAAVPPGDYTLTFTHPDLDCGDPIDVTVTAGFVTTNVGPVCETPKK